MRASEDRGSSCRDRPRLNAASLVALAAIGAALLGGKVLATPATTPGFSGTTLAKATFGDLDIKAKTIPADVWKAEVDTKGDSDLYVQQNTWDPSLCGGCVPSTGWHTHPGPSLVIVTQGTVTEYEGDDPTCTPHQYSASGTNAFVDIGSGAVHMIRNESGAVAKTVVVQLIPKDATRRIDVTPAPGNCPFLSPQQLEGGMPVLQQPSRPRRDSNPRFTPGTRLVRMRECPPTR